MLCVHVCLHMICLHVHTVVGDGIPNHKPLLVSLLHYLYEAQDPSLCQFVAEQLEDGLNLNNTSLTPVDCLAVGYFISPVPLTTNSVSVFTVYLRNCSLGDPGTKSLMQSIFRSVDPHNTVNTHLSINLINNEECAPHIAEVLSRTSIVSTLSLFHNVRVNW